MTLAILLSVVAILCLYFGTKWKQSKDRQKVEDYSITADRLHELMNSKKDVLVYDVRLPLDLLTDSEIIPGAKRVPPKEIEADPNLIPKDKDTIVYCTCPSDRTSRAIIDRALEADFHRVKFLKGGLAAWKEKGYPVERYEESFRLDTGS